MRRIRLRMNSIELLLLQGHVATAILVNGLAIGAQLHQFSLETGPFMLVVVAGRALIRHQEGNRSLALGQNLGSAQYRCECGGGS